MSGLISADSSGQNCSIAKKICFGVDLPSDREVTELLQGSESPSSSHASLEHEIKEFNTGRLSKSAREPSPMMLLALRSASSLIVRLYSWKFQ